MSGVGPALLLVVLMCVMIYSIARLRPGKIPPVGDVHYTWKERLSSLKLLVSVLAFFLLVIGGTFKEPPGHRGWGRSAR